MKTSFAHGAYQNGDNTERTELLFGERVMKNGKKDS